MITRVATKWTEFTGRTPAGAAIVALAVVATIGGCRVDNATSDSGAGRRRRWHRPRPRARQRNLPWRRSKPPSRRIRRRTRTLARRTCTRPFRSTPTSAAPGSRRMRRTALHRAGRHGQRPEAQHRPSLDWVPSPTTRVHRRDVLDAGPAPRVVTTRCSTIA